MSNEPTLWQQLGINLQDIIAGFSGGLVNAFVFKQVQPWTIIGSVVVGGLTANYLGPMVARYISGETTRGAAAFITGLAGMYLCQRIVDSAKDWRPFKTKGNSDA
jgi:uncharacterized membrane protein YfcA